MRVPMMIGSDLPTSLRSAFLVSSFLFGATGCGGGDPAPAVAPRGTPTPANADPDDVPITEADVARPRDYPEALKRIEGYRDTIRDEVAAGRPAKAHRALDELDIVLDWLPGVARDGGVAKDGWEAVNTTAQKIRDLFNQVHSRIDAKAEPDYASVSAAIDEAIASLKGIPSGTSPGEATVKP